MKVGVISPYPLARAALIAFLLQAGTFSITSDMGSVDDLRRGLDDCPDVWVLHVPNAHEFSQTVKRLHACCPDAPILGMLKESALEIEAIKAGARGLISWNSSPKTFLKAVRAVAHGEVWLSERAAKAYISHHLIPLSGEQQSAPKLTEREAEILAIAASGQRRAEIAAHLHVSLFTVCSHLRTIYRKLDVDNRTSAILAYLQSVQPQAWRRKETIRDDGRLTAKPRAGGAGRIRVPARRVSSLGP
jgi:DNA-binding NarL/FixJ family response regulator